jgi:predicted Zn-dependent peptidase
VKQTLHSATLDNGIVLLGEELPDLESVAVAFHVPAGGIHDGPGRCGLASLSSEMMLRGAGDRESRQLVEDFALAGINWSNAVSTTHATYFGALVARRLPEAMPIYADIIRRPMLPEDQFESGQQVVLQGLAGTDDDPSHRTMLALKKLVFPAPWGLPSEGLSADVEQLTPAAVREFVDRHVRPDGMIVAAAGRLNWFDFVRRMETLFGDWQPGMTVPIEQGSRGGRWQHVEHDSHQTHIAIAWSVPPYSSDDSYEATAALSVLGGGTSSRFFTEVRERRGLCYSVSAGYSTQKDFASAICYAGTSGDRAQQTLDVMLEEIRRLPSSITEDELSRVKARAKSGLVMQQESSSSRAGGIARQWYHLGRVRPLADELQRLDRLSVASVRNWLERNPPADLSIVSLGRNPLEVPHELSS